MTLSTSWQKVVEKVSEKVNGSNVNAYVSLYMKYGNRDTNNNRDTIYWEIRARASVAYYYDGYDKSYSIKDGSTTRASGTYKQGTSPSDAVTTTERVLASGNWIQTHNNDGSWSSTITFNACVYETYFTENVSISLPSIARYAEFSTQPYLSSRDEHKLGITYRADRALGAAQYTFKKSTDSSYGSWTNLGVALATTFNISNLEPGTTYNIKVRIQASGSNLWRESNVLTASTLDSVMDYNVNGTWKKVTPFINVNGVWKKTKPFMKINGTWKDGIN